MCNPIKRLLVIVFVLLLSLPVFMLADDYIDDVYYSPEVELSNISTTSTPSTPYSAPLHQPYYNKKAMQEIIFIDDTLTQQMPDTVRAIIKR